MNRAARVQSVTIRTGFVSVSTVVSLLFIAVVSVVGWVSFGITAADRWPIKWLEIEGRFERVSAERVRASLLPQIRSSYFTLDLDALRDIAADIHWVAEVRLRKQWPDTVFVTIFEHRPVAHWNQDRLISAEGEIFAVPEAGSLQGLPWLWGADQQFDKVVDRWVGLNKDLAALGLEVANIRLDKRGSWEMILSNGTRIKLGRNATEQRLARLLESWDELVSGREMQPDSIDLRYTNGFAVNWKSGAEELVDLRKRDLTGGADT